MSKVHSRGYRYLGLERGGGSVLSSSTCENACIVPTWNVLDHWMIFLWFQALSDSLAENKTEIVLSLIKWDFIYASCTVIKVLLYLLFQNCIESLTSQEYFNVQDYDEVKTGNVNTCENLRTGWDREISAQRAIQPKLPVAVSLSPKHVYLHWYS